jgi:hypothetical protein
MGAGASGSVATLGDLEGKFSGNRLEASHAYATAAGFLRFALRRTGDSGALGDLHERLHLGLDFSAAWVATFGVPPEDLFALYARFLDSSGSKWAVFLGDGVVWSIVSLLFILSLLVGWHRRPVLGDGTPMDLEAIAAAGAYAMRTGHFVAPLDDDAPPDPAARAAHAPPARVVAPRSNDEGGEGDDDTRDDDTRDDDTRDDDTRDDDTRDDDTADDDTGDDRDDHSDDDSWQARMAPRPATALARAGRQPAMRRRYDTR